MTESNVFSLKHVERVREVVDVSVIKFCKFDNARCFNPSCEVFFSNGSVVSCRRRRGYRGRFTRAKSGVGF